MFDPRSEDMHDMNESSNQYKRSNNVNACTITMPKLLLIVWAMHWRYVRRHLMGRVKFSALS
jgi:hypothetical protein